MNSVVEYVAKCINPVNDQTMNRIDYVLLTLLNLACTLLLKAWLALPVDPTREAVAQAMSQGWIPSLVLWWIWFCATMNRAADTGVTRAGFAKVYFLAPFLSVVLFVMIPSVLTLLIIVAVIIVPTIFLFFWPGRYA